MNFIHLIVISDEWSKHQKDGEIEVNRLKVGKSYEAEVNKLILQVVHVT